MNNLIIWNLEDKSKYLLLSGDNLVVSKTSDSPDEYSNIRTTVGKSKGKWYWEGTLTGMGGLGISPQSEVGISYEGNSTPTSSHYTKFNQCWIYWGESYTQEVLFNAGSTISIALDFENDTLSYFLNGNLVSKKKGFKELTNNETVYPLLKLRSAHVETNFGTKPFEHMSNDLKKEGYKPYDIDNSHEDNLKTLPITWNPDKSNGIKFNLDRLTAISTSTNNNYRHARATIGYSKGKYYYEAKVNKWGGQGHFGIWDDARTVNADGNGDPQGIVGYSNGAITTNGVIQTVSEGYGENDIIGVAIDLDDKICSFYKNGKPIGKSAKFDFSSVKAIVYRRNNWEATANFGATPFKYLSKDLKKQGYLPYDLENADRQNLPNKFLFRRNNKLYQPTPAGINLLSETSITSNLIDEVGTTDITDIVGLNKVILEEGQEVDSHWEFSEIIEVIKYFENIRLEEK